MSICQTSIHVAIFMFLRLLLISTERAGALGSHGEITHTAHAIIMCQLILSQKMQPFHSMIKSSIYAMC